MRYSSGPRLADVAIRRAIAPDVEGILECLRLAFEPYRDRYTPAAFEDTVLSAEALERRMVAMSLFVAVNQRGTLLGTIGYRVLGGGEGHLRGMAVRPGEHGTGVAQRLLEAAEAGMRRDGCRIATLDTTQPLERATRFYERNGFRRSGVVRDFFHMPLIEYVKRLE